MAQKKAAKTPAPKPEQIDWAGKAQQLNNADTQKYLYMMGQIAETDDVGRRAEIMQEANNWLIHKSCNINLDKVKNMDITEWPDALQAARDAQPALRQAVIEGK